MDLESRPEPAQSPAEPILVLPSPMSGAVQSAQVEPAALEPRRRDMTLAPEPSKVLEASAVVAPAPLEDHDGQASEVPVAKGSGCCVLA